MTLHDLPIWRGEARGRVHPCGVPAEPNPYAPNYTRTPRPSNFDYATGKRLPREVVDCPGCIAARERHRAACEVAR